MKERIPIILLISWNVYKTKNKTNLLATDGSVSGGSKRASGFQAEGAKTVTSWV